MQLTKTLKVTPEELFDALAGSIMQDIENATGKRPSRNKLNGYKYEKRAQSAKGKAKGTAIKVKIKHFDYPCLYEVRFQYAAGINTMRYEAAPAGDGACELTYTEDFQGVGGSTSGTRGKLGLFFYERKLKSHANQTIDQIVKYIEGERRVKANPAFADDTAENASVYSIDTLCKSFTALHINCEHFRLRISSERPDKNSCW